MTLAGEDDSVIGPADVDLGEGTTTVVYAWGSAEDDNLKLAVQTIDGMGGNPGGVPGGTGGQAGAASPATLGLLGLGLAGLVLAARACVGRSGRAEKVPSLR